MQKNKKYDKILEIIFKINLMWNFNKMETSRDLSTEEKIFQERAWLSLKSRMKKELDKNSRPSLPEKVRKIEISKHLQELSNSLPTPKTQPVLPNNQKIKEIISYNEAAKKHLNKERILKAHEWVIFLMKKWLTSAQAIWVIANWVAENGLKTDEHKHWLWVFQWIGTRARKYKQMYNKLEWSNDFEKQLSYMLHELATTERRAWIKLSQANNSDDAARVFMLDFERPKNKDTTERRAIARALTVLTKTNS